MPTLTASSLTEDGRVGGMSIPAPQSNTYKSSAATSSAALKDQTAVLGHNTFRADVYKVSEGYVA